MHNSCTIPVFKFSYLIAVLCTTHLSIHFIRGKDWGEVRVSMRLCVAINLDLVYLLSKDKIKYTERIIIYRIINVYADLCCQMENYILPCEYVSPSSCNLKLGNLQIGWITVCQIVKGDLILKKLGKYIILYLTT